MRHIVLAVILVAAGAAAGIGAYAFWLNRPSEPDSTGLVIVCDRDAFVAWARPHARCWQGGQRVKPPPGGEQCGPYPEIRWDRVTDVRALYAYACFGTE